MQTYPTYSYILGIKILKIRLFYFAQFYGRFRCRARNSASLAILQDITIVVQSTNTNVESKVKA
jgi:hypothetical protein